MHSRKFKCPLCQFDLSDGSATFHVEVLAEAQAAQARAEEALANLNRQHWDRERAFLVGDQILRQQLEDKKQELKVLLQEKRTQDMYNLIPLMYGMYCIMTGLFILLQGLSLHYAMLLICMGFVTAFTKSSTISLGVLLVWCGGQYNITVKNPSMLLTLGASFLAVTVVIFLCACVSRRRLAA